MSQFDILLENVVGILSVVPQTLLLAVIIFFLSISVGLVMTLIQIFKVPVFSQIVYLLKLFLRGTPMIVFIYLTYFGLPIAVEFLLSLVAVDFNPDTLSPNIMIIVALTLTLSPFQSEIIRGAFSSIDHGQIAAARSLGYTFPQSMRKVIIPQAFEEALPDLTNSFMVILKALTLAFLITVVDIFAKARLLAAINFHYLQAFIIAALIYWALAYILTKSADTFERRYSIRGAR